MLAVHESTEAESSGQLFKDGRAVASQSERESKHANMRLVHNAQPDPLLAGYLQEGAVWERRVGMGDKKVLTKLKS